MLMCRFGPPLAFNFMAAIAMPPSKHDARESVENTVRTSLCSVVRFIKLWLCDDAWAGSCFGPASMNDCAGWTADEACKRTMQLCC